MPDFKNFSSDPTSPAVDYYAITPADSDLVRPVRALYVGVSGNITVTNPKGGSVLFSNVPAGSILPVSAIRVSATGTTATGIVGIE